MTSHENNEAGDVRGLYALLVSEAAISDRPGQFKALTDAAEQALNLLDEVDTLHDRLRDMEIERNMLRICVKELTDSLEAGDACGAVGCRAMERLAKVERVVDTHDFDPTYYYVQEQASALIADLRAALSTERGEGRE